MPPKGAGPSDLAGTAIATPTIREDELDAIVRMARRGTPVPCLTTERLVAEVRRLRSDLLAAVFMGLELTRELRETAAAERVGPPGAPRLADYDS